MGVKVCVHAMKTYKGSSDVTPLTTSALDGVKSSALTLQLLYPVGKSPRYTLNRRNRIEDIIFKITEANYLSMAVSSEISINDSTSNNYPGFEVTNCSRVALLSVVTSKWTYLDHP